MNICCPVHEIFLLNKLFLCVTMNQQNVLHHDKYPFSLEPFNLPGFPDPSALQPSWVPRPPSPSTSLGSRLVSMCVRHAV